ncbi:DUF6668 family protein [Marinactinospora rubrisoli]|uniref:DUF6668 family protein n=1 Tax=Marinactinospora rubrisoli TaxID=2715399 RepID=A0ABW2KIM6_9ACTN
MTEHNPWITVATPVTSEEENVGAAQEPPRVTGPQRPQSGVPVPQGGDLLPRRSVAEFDGLWWLGVHGGAGETTLSALVERSRTAQHAWPEPVSPEMASGVTMPPRLAKVILVARTHAHGLRAAQLAATEWASGAVPGVDVLGMALVADAPGRLPRSLRDMAKIVTGGVPRVWQIPWVESWRLGEQVTLESSPKAVQVMVTELAALLAR